MLIFKPLFSKVKYMYIKELPVRFLESDYFLKFIKKIVVKEKNECWPWIGAITFDRANKPRPYVKLNNISYYAARVMYFIIHKKDPKELLVCHSCDNEYCMNTHHLFLGTHQDNKNDSVFKERHAYGEKCSRVFNEEDIFEIRKLYFNSINITYREIANKYNVTVACISDIINRKRWAHI